MVNDNGLLAEHSHSLNIMIFIANEVPLIVGDEIIMLKFYHMIGVFN